MKKVFLKDAAAVFTLSNGKKCALMGTLELMVEDVVGKALRLANEEERHEMEDLMDADMRHWQAVEQQTM
jgi:hypothetical protein